MGEKRASLHLVVVFTLSKCEKCEASIDQCHFLVSEFENNLCVFKQSRFANFKALQSRKWHCMQVRQWPIQLPIEASIALRRRPVRNAYSKSLEERRWCETRTLTVFYFALLPFRRSYFYQSYHCQAY